MVTPAAYLCPSTYKYKLKVGCNGDVSENKFRKKSIDILTRPTNKTTRGLYMCVRARARAGQPSGFIELYTNVDLSINAYTFSSASILR